MDVDYVAYVVEIAAAGAVYQATGVVIRRPLGDFLGLELPPGFIERHPHHDAGKIVVGVHDCLPFPPKNAFRLGSAIPLGTLAFHAGPRFPFVAEVAAGHVLPHQHPQQVAVVVPAGGFYFHVLADHVEAHVARFLDVKQQRRVGGRGVEAVRPPALVERAVLKHKFVVDQHPLDALGVGLAADLAHGEVASHLVHHFVFAHQCHR